MRDRFLLTSHSFSSSSSSSSQSLSLSQLLITRWSLTEIWPKDHSFIFRAFCGFILLLLIISLYQCDVCVGVVFLNLLAFVLFSRMSIPHMFELYFCLLDCVPVIFLFLKPLFSGLLTFCLTLYSISLLVWLFHFLHFWLHFSFLLFLPLTSRFSSITDKRCRSCQFPLQLHFI